MYEPLLVSSVFVFSLHTEITVCLFRMNSIQLQAYISQVMSLGEMLSSNNLNNLLPKLECDGGNWLIWKHCTQMFLTAKKLAHHMV